MRQSRELLAAAATVAVVVFVGRVQGPGTNQNEGLLSIADRAREKKRKKKKKKKKTWGPHVVSAILNSRSKYAAAAAAAANEYSRRPQHFSSDSPEFTHGHSFRA